MGFKRDEPPVGRVPPPPLDIKVDNPHWDRPTVSSLLLAENDEVKLTNHYAAIGHVAAAWGYFEAVIDTWAITFSGLDPKIGVCFVSHILGARSKIDSFISLAKELNSNKKWNKKWIEVLDEFASNTQGLGDQRNRAVHDVWIMDEPEKPIRLEASARRSVRLLTVHHTTDKLLRLSENIYALSAKFDEMAGEIFTDLHSKRKPSPDKRPKDTHN